MDLTKIPLHRLYDLHTELCDAHTAMHNAWHIAYQAERIPGNEYHQLGSQISALIHHVSNRIDALVDSDGNPRKVATTEDITPDAQPAAPVVTEWDENDHGYMFELDHGDTGHVLRRSDGTYCHYSPEFVIITPVESVASAREIAVASYMAKHRIGA